MSASGRILALFALAAFTAMACGRPPAVPPGRPVAIALAPRIVTPSDVTTEAELAARAELALVQQRWGQAAQAYRTLFAAEPIGPRAAEYLFNLGLSLEGSGDRAPARDAFLAVARRFPAGAQARAALVRAATLDAYLEDWAALATIGEELLGRRDLDDVDRIVALGARGLARIETGADQGASKDILDGLELGDRLHYGDREVLPVAIAQLRFGLGEIRRVRSERLQFDPLPPDFLDRLDLRCAGLLQAQAAYAQAVRSVDPHWAEMSGYRVGTMYGTLHRDLMRIPPPARSKTDRQKDIFFAFMHVRYRVLLEKGLREIEQTIALGERTSDSSPWFDRARQAKVEMQAALSEEEAQLKAMPFTEAEIEEALLRLKKKKASPHSSP